MAADISLSISVSELNRRARVAIERAIPLLWVNGEISNLTRAASGHVYFTLKDDAAQVRCVMFRSRASLVPWQIANGQQVEVQALVSLYEARGDFQLNVEAMRRGGLGKLYEAFARLRAALEAEGLFAAERKRTLPRFPRAIGIVSSPQAAALRDIVAACRRRAPHVPLMLFATPVQGEGSAARIAQAIASADQMAAQAGLDILIVARGGGSIEDLWAFNEEAVARALAACSIPVVSGVGHETDVTIADLVADHRGATPTAAAELATAGWFAAARELESLSATLQARMQRLIETRMQRIDLLSRCLVHPRQRLERIAMTLPHLRRRLGNALHADIARNAGQLATLRLQLHRSRPQLALTDARLAALRQQLMQTAHRLLIQRARRLDSAADALKLLDPRATLARGYGIIRDAAGKAVTNSATLKPGDDVQLQFAIGDAEAHIDRVR